MDRPSPRPTRLSSASTPGLYSVEAFDAANIFLAAIKAGNTTRSAIQTYLGTVNYQGLAKTYSFTSTGELAGSAIVYAYQVKNGVIVGLKGITVIVPKAPRHPTIPGRRAPGSSAPDPIRSPANLRSSRFLPSTTSSGR